MSEFNKRETVTVFNGACQRDGIGAIYIHRPTGLVVGLEEDKDLLDGPWIQLRTRPEMNILKHVWVEVWFDGETTSYWVEDIDDIMRLKELLEETDATSVKVAVSADFIEAALVDL